MLRALSRESRYKGKARDGIFGQLQRKIGSAVS